jgi:hypothetical protein
MKLVIHAEVVQECGKHASREQCEASEADESNEGGEGEEGIGEGIVDSASALLQAGSIGAFITLGTLALMALTSF